jgi:hypothetical protein
MPEFLERSGWFRLAIHNQGPNFATLQFVVLWQGSRAIRRIPTPHRSPALLRS